MTSLKIEPNVRRPRLVGVVLFASSLFLSSCVSSSNSTVSPSTSTTVHQAHTIILPSPAVPGDQQNDYILLPVTKGSGSRSVPKFSPRGSILYIQFTCSGKGYFELVGFFKYEPCNGLNAVLTNQYPNQDGLKISTSVIASTSVKWELFISSGPVQRN
jgi:hypothetical protein